MLSGHLNELVVEYKQTWSKVGVVSCVLIVIPQSSYQSNIFWEKGEGCDGHNFFLSEDLQKGDAGSQPNVLGGK